jgi:hypothetical protein
LFIQNYQQRSDYAFTANCDGYVILVDFNNSGCVILVKPWMKFQFHISVPKMIKDLFYVIDMFFEGFQEHQHVINIHMTHFPIQPS